MPNFPEPAQYSEDCNTGTLGVVRDGCAPEFKDSEIRKIYMSEVDPADKSKPKYFPADPTDPASWASVINATAAGMKVFDVVAGMPAPPQNIREIGGFIAQLERKWNVIGQMIDGSDENYEFARSLQGGGEVFLWFKTKGNKLYGATDVADSLSGTAAKPYHPYGVKVSIKNFHPNIQVGENNTEQHDIDLQWEAVAAPPRYHGDSPI